MSTEIQDESAVETALNPERHSLILQDETEGEKGQVRPKTFTIPLVLTTISCVIGSPFQFGYNLGVINAPEEAIKSFFNGENVNFGELQWAATVAVFAAGGLIGSTIAPLVADRFGRKRTLVLNNLVGILAGTLMSFSYVAVSPAMLILGRIIVGINAGANTVVAPCYLTEVSPVKIRGSLGTLNQLGINLGILMSQVLGISQFLGTSNRWPFLLGAMIVPAVFQLSTLPFCPSSPKFLFISQNDREGATQVDDQALKTLRGTDNVEEDLEELTREKLQHEQRKFSLKDLFTSKELRMPILISIMMQMVNQFTGINAVVGYSTSIFRDAGVKDSAAATCGVGVVAVIMTLLTVKLIEIKGRRVLLMAGLIGMGVFYLIITTSLSLQRTHGIDWTKYISVVCVLCIMSIYQFGPGPIPWFIVAELFPQESRGAALSLSGFTNWLSTFLILFGYPPLESAIGPFTFLVFVVIVILLLIFTYRYVPETKGRTIEEITSAYRVVQNGDANANGDANTNGDANANGTVTDEFKIAVTEDTKKQSHLTWTLFLTATSCVIGSPFQFGYNLGVINAPEEIIKKYFNMKGVDFGNIQWASTVAVFAAGGLIGAIAGPLLADRVGRKRTLILNNFFAIAAGLLMAGSYFSVSPAMLIIGRIVVGLNAGANTVVSPLYLSEVAPVKIRGSLGTLNQLGINIGILASQVMGIPQVLGSLNLWPYLLGMTIAPALFQLCTLPFCPSSPKFLLISRNNREDAIKALERLRGNQNVDKELDEMTAEKDRQSRERKFTIRELFFAKHLRAPLLISIVMQLANQMTGINAVVGYSTSIFNEAGVKNSATATCGVGAVAIVMTLLTVRLIEVKGRRFLLMLGLAGMGIFYIAITISLSLQHQYGIQWTKYISVACVLAIMSIYQFGPGPIPWFIVAELFTQGPRGAALSISGFCNWLATFIILFGYPPLEAAIHSYTFLVFVVVVVLLLVFTYFKVPETKGRTIEDISRHFRNDEPTSNIQGEEDTGILETTALAEKT